MVFVAKYFNTFSRQFFVNFFLEIKAGYWVESKKNFQSNLIKHVFAKKYSTFFFKNFFKIYLCEIKKNNNKSDSKKCFSQILNTFLYTNFTIFSKQLFQVKLKAKPFSQYIFLNNEAIRNFLHYLTIFFCSCTHMA